jgi:hypothetical protein
VSAQAAAGERAHGGAEVQAALERVFAHPRLRAREPDLLERGLERLLEVFSGFDVEPRAVTTLLWVAAAVLAALGGWLLARALAGRARAPAAAPAAGDLPPAPVDVEARLADLRARAETARAAGDLELALRLSFSALLVALSRRGDLELREAWTPREMLARGRPSERARAALEPWLSELDRLLFGARGVTPEDLARFDALRANLLAEGRGGAA